MKKLIALFVTIILSIGIFGCQNEEGSSDQDQSGSDPITKEIEKEVQNPEYSMEEIAKHSQKGDCWIIIDHNVYDVSSYAEMHPGRDSILEGCGQDSTELFETRPMGSGTPHSEDARKFLENYNIGVLKQ